MLPCYWYHITLSFDPRAPSSSSDLTHRYLSPALLVGTARIAAYSLRPFLPYRSSTTASTLLGPLSPLSTLEADAS